MKILVTSAPRSGTHFIVRSLGLSLKTPVAIRTTIKKLPTEDSWIIGTHDLNLIKNCPPDVIKIGIHREMLGHLLSYFNHPKNPNSDAFIDMVKKSNFFNVRKAFLNLNIPYLSYDKLAKKESLELNKLSVMFNTEMVTENYESSILVFGSSMFKYGNPDKWKSVFDIKTQNILINIEQDKTK
jgi:hypothetical protein